MKTVYFYEVCKINDAGEEFEPGLVFAERDLAERYLKWQQACNPWAKFHLFQNPTADGPIGRLLDFMDERGLTEKSIEHARARNAPTTFVPETAQGESHEANANSEAP